LFFGGFIWQKLIGFPEEKKKKKECSKQKFFLGGEISHFFKLKNMILTFSTKDFCGGKKKVGPNSQDLEILGKNFAFIFGLL
jgi:hypothetical protein